MDTQELQSLKNRFDIIGNDAALNAALEMAMNVASTDLTCLISGESGVGKDVIPKIIHQFSARKTKKYLAVNCAAIPEGTVDSELFGHEKGSFTGAIEARKGYFEEANGGTLFLDEIGELPMSTQAKLLRVLQSGEYIRVGSSKVEKTDVRLIAATNVDLPTAVSKGKFRADLYYRLSSVRIDIPPLRERKEDIYLLFRKFTSDFSERYGRKKISLTRDAITLLTSYRWPGNIRELQNISDSVSLLETSAATSNSERIEIDAQTLSKYIKTDGSDMLPVMFHDTSASISEDDKQEILRALYTLNAKVANLEKIVSSGGYNSKEVPRSPEEHHVISGGNLLPKHGVWSRDDDDVDIQEEEPAIVPQRPRVSPDIDDQSADAEGSLAIKGNNEELIRKALERHGGNRKKAAAELGISERTLYRKLPPEYRKQKS